MSEDKMKLDVEQVKEALKCCADGSRAACLSCPYHKGDTPYQTLEGLVDCMEGLMRDVLDLMEE